MASKQSLDAAYFRDVYNANDDPWDFETSAYEAQKYAATVAALPHAHYQHALEIGCSIGVLTKRLAERCTQLLATDVSEKALARARERCKDTARVTFRQSSFTANVPETDFDLILISEVAYYLSPEDWENEMEHLVSKLKAGAHLMLVHWLPDVHDYPQTGDEVHDRFAKQMDGRMRNVFNSRAERYRIDVWESAGSE
ncbi:MAG: methyltransferase domain-containing protein [Sphingobacteriales bacterium]|nr:MAG: methyltransferase domain-containing protein [Sphingobacteriales bacterium]